MKNFEKILFASFVILVFFFFFKFLSCDILAGDDISVSSCAYKSQKFNFYFLFYYFIPKMFATYFPHCLNINPHQFSVTVGAFCRSFNITLLFITISAFAFIGRKINSSFLFIFFLSVFYFCYASSNMDFYIVNSNLLPSYDLEGSFTMLTQYSRHFGIFLPFILNLFGFVFMINLFVNNNFPNPKYLYPIASGLFLISNCSLFISFISLSLLISIGLYIFIADIKKQIDFDKIKIYCFFALSSFFGLFLCIIQNLNCFYLNQKLSLKYLIKNAIVSNCFEFALLFSLTAVLYLLAANKTTFIKRIIFSVFSIVCALFIYILSFSKWYLHSLLDLNEFQILIRLILFSLILLLFGACRREFYLQKITKNVITISFALVLFAFVIIQTPFIYTAMKLWMISCQETKVTTYCLEKMYRFYSLLNKTALLPNDALLKIYKISNFIDDPDINKNEKITSSLFFKKTSFISYYKKYYKNPIIVPYKFIESKKALKIFFEQGGIIDKNEIKHLNFQKLYNDEFVLNRAIIKAKYDK